MFLFINFKAYEESTGQRALNLIRSIEREIGNNPSLILVVNPLDSMIETTLKKYIQSAEPLTSGPYTGHIPVALMRNYGYSGIMLNHSENKLDPENIKKSIKMARDHGLRCLVCAADQEEVKRIIPLEPDYIAYEPPELIGGNISVSTEKPEIIEAVAHMLNETKIALIVGAGIKNNSDIRISKQLGAEGVLISSGVVKSPDPIRVIVEMIKEVS